MTVTDDVLHRTDFLRGSLRSLGEPGPHKEWHHFVVHDPRLRLIVNFSLTDRAGPHGTETVPRIIALVRHGHYTGTVETFDLTDCELRTGRVAARFGPCSFALVGGAYELTVELPTIHLRARLRLLPASTPFVVSNQPLAPRARLSWLCVPRLHAHGDVWVGENRFSLRDAPAYHDHNWGRFRWGDDFGWVWGSVLPACSTDPWTIVFMCMTDRFRRRANRQGLYIWHGRDAAAMWRDSVVKVEHEGLLRRRPALTLPRVMRVLRPGSASDLPRRLVIRGGQDGDELRLTFEPDDYVRLVVPDEHDELGLVVLNEVNGRVVAGGEIDGSKIDLEGSGVFEFLH
jgi:hypothetical protein